MTVSTQTTHTYMNLWTHIRLQPPRIALEYQIVDSKGRSSNLCVNFEMCFSVLLIVYNVSESKLPKILQISLNFTVFTFGKGLQTGITRENLFFATFSEVSSGICVQILRFRNKFLPFIL